MVGAFCSRPRTPKPASRETLPELGRTEIEGEQEEALRASRVLGTGLSGTVLLAPLKRAFRCA